MKPLRISIFILVVTGLRLHLASAQTSDSQEQAKDPRRNQLAKVREAREAAARGVDWPSPDPIEGERKKGIVRPRETFVYQGVAVRWEIPDATETERDLLGWLSFQSPGGSIDRVEVPADLSEGQTRTVYRRGETGAYLAGIAFAEIRMAWDDSYATLPEFLAGGLEFFVAEQPRHLDIAGGPEKLRAYVSALCRLTVNEWELEVSDRPVEPVAGEVFHALTIRNTETRESETMPLLLNIRKTFGRYDVTVTAFDPTSETAALAIEAGPDTTVRGRDAWVREFRLEADTMRELLEQLGQAFGFELEWTPEPGHPESIEYAQSMTSPPVYRLHTIRSLPLEKALREILRDGELLAYEWLDDTHLRVSSTDYGEVVARREMEARRTQEVAEFSRIFEEAYSSETMVYRLQQMKASTAEKLVERLLSVFYLHVHAPDQPHSMARSACSVIRSGEFASITACRKTALEDLPEKARETHGDFLKIARSAMKESVVADEMSNSIIVTAVPETHEQIRSLIERMEGLVQAKAPPGAVERHSLAVVLLSGEEAEREPMVVFGFPIDGVVQEVLAEPGQKVEAGDVLARLDSDAVKLRIQELKAVFEGSRAQLAAEREEYERLKLMSEKGKVSQKDVRDAEVKVIELESKVQATATRIEQEQLRLEKGQLRSPASGTLVDVTLRPNQKVSSDDWVVTLRKAIPPDTVMPSTQPSRELMGKYGIAAEDLETFGLRTLKELGKGVVSLAAERGDTAAVRLSLTEEYGCELEFLDLREPYLVVRGRLTAVDREQPLIENTLYLEKDSPSLLGVTNLREGLILLVRRRG